MTKPCDMENIRKIIYRASSQERKDLCTLLEYNPPRTYLLSEISEDISNHLLWKYQTPLGYMVRTPSFDDICKDIAKKLNKKLKPKLVIREEYSCWKILEVFTKAFAENIEKKIDFDGFKEDYDKMSPEDRKEFAKESLNEKEFEEFSKTCKGDWSKIGAGVIFKSIKHFGGFATYKTAAIVANQLARLFLGRGLSFAANATLMRVVSVTLGPIGWLLLVWGINDLLGTNYKRLIPATFYIYSIYERLKAEDKLPSNIR